MLNRSPAQIDEQPRAISRLNRNLRNPLRRKRVVEVREEHDQESKSRCAAVRSADGGCIPTCSYAAASATRPAGGPRHHPLCDQERLVDIPQVFRAVHQR